MPPPQQRDTEQPISFDSSQIKRRLILLEGKSGNFVTKDYFEKTIGEVKIGITEAIGEMKSDMKENTARAIGEMKTENAKIPGNMMKWLAPILVVMLIGILSLVLRLFLSNSGTYPFF